MHRAFKPHFHEYCFLRGTTLGLSSFYYDSYTNIRKGYICGIGQGGASYMPRMRPYSYDSATRSFRDFFIQATRGEAKFGSEAKYPARDKLRRSSRTIFLSAVEIARNLFRDFAGMMHDTPLSNSCACMCQQLFGVISLCFVVV